MREALYGTETDRFWAMPADPTVHPMPFENKTIGIVDELQGGIILYAHEDNVDMIIGALRDKETN